MITIPSLNDCRELLFEYIRLRMASSEPAPDYEREERGCRNLESAFELMRRPEYEGVLGKGAYLFCSVIDGHHFSNGNKRLAVTLLTFFLLSNHYKIHVPNMVVIRSELQKQFPHLHWEHVTAFRFPHEYFFYHLALIIADRQQKGKLTFQQEQKSVRTLLEVIAVAP